jgi:hypothetical protein
MLVLGCVLFGILFDRYIIPLLDLWLQDISNKQVLNTTKMQSEIDAMSGEQQEQIQENTNAIGFNYTPTNEFDEE